MRAFFLSLLLLSLSFAWVNPPPSCVNSVSLSSLGVNFSYNMYSNSYALGNYTNSTCEGSTKGGYGVWVGYDAVGCPGPSSTEGWNPYNATHAKLTGGCMMILNLPLPSSGDYSGYLSGAADTRKLCAFNYSAYSSSYIAYGCIGNTSAAGNFNITDFNSTHYKINTTTETGYIPKTQRIMALVSNAASYIYYPYYNTSYTSPYFYPYNDFNYFRYYTMQSALENYMGINSNTKYVVRSDFKTNNYTEADYANQFQAVLLYNSEMIIPVLTYTPSLWAYYRHVNTTTNAAWLKNNTPTYVYDGTSWYYVPALSVPNYADVYTISIYYVSSGGAVSYTPPIIPLSLYCQENGAWWNVSSSYSVGRTHNVTWSNDSSTLSYQTSGSSFSYAINITNATEANYTVNGNIVCMWNTNSTILPIPSIGLPEQSTKIFLSVIWLVAIAIGVLNPFAFIFAAAFNDTIGIVNTATMAGIVVVGGVLSVAIKRNDNSLKTLLFNFIIALGILLLFTNLSGYSMDLTEVNNFYASIQAFSANNSTSDITTFALATPGFVINLLLLILHLPAIFVNLLSAPLYQVSPLLGTTAAFMLNGIMLAAVVVILMKAYEIIRNMFRPM